MESMTIQQRLWALVEPIAAAAGLETVDIELTKEGGGTVLRIYLDRRGGGGGIDLNTLARISGQLSDELHVHDPLPGPYTLEVSSPGINRRLRVPEHFRRYIGERIRVRCSVPVEGRRNFVGTLRAVTGEGVVVVQDERECFVPFQAIAQANYEHDFGAEGSQRPRRRHHAARA
jgi:ribosome maturation factor RimP